jgi:allantoinase
MRTSIWEGLATGSAALAAGGGTCFFDMPLNSEPPVLDAASFRVKRALAEENACVDFALWGGLVPGNLDKLAGLRDVGAIGLKAFMCPSGIESFPHVDAASLKEGMKRAAKLGLLVAVHAEDDALAAKFAAEQKAKGRTDAKAWLASRPVEVELAAIRLALELAGETGCALHLVHVSSPEGIALVMEARDQRVDVTAETCPHYLLLNDKDVARLGAIAKCAPPLRDEKRRVGLWADLRAGRIQTVGSDHSPSLPEMKDSANMFAVWGGIAGCQHGFELLMSECAKTAEKDLPMLAAVLARNVARRFRLDARKGELAEGRDADFSLIKFGTEHEIAADSLWTRHRISPYVGRKSRVRVTHTCVRGCAVYADGRLTNLPQPGQFLAPHRGNS